MNIACNRMSAIYSGVFEEVSNAMFRQTNLNFWFVPCLLRCSRISRSRAADVIGRQLRTLCYDYSGLKYLQ
jgi:hypothetical protein